MEYELKPSHFFLQQIDEISDDAIRIIENRLNLLKITHFATKGFMDIISFCLG